MHGGLSPELKALEQIKRIPRPTDVPDTGLLCDLLWADPDKEARALREPQAIGCTGLDRVAFPYPIFCAVAELAVIPNRLSKAILC